MLKRDKKKLEEKKNEISLVDLIERERAALGPNQTKITLETFLAWKKKKIKDRQVCGCGFYYLNSLFNISKYYEEVKCLNVTNAPIPIYFFWWEATLFLIDYKL